MHFLVKISVEIYKQIGNLIIKEIASSFLFFATVKVGKK